MKHFESVLITDGQKSYTGNQIIDNPAFKEHYDAANERYQPFVEEINRTPGIYLQITLDANNRPTFTIENARNELLRRLKSAGLS